MKIHKLLFENINSLYGKWEIDFDHQDFQQNGIFAITGKTGSGKTTILDAICLALYAETPRITHGNNKEIISKGATECLAELTFSDSHGIIWVASFAYLNRKRGQKKGEIAKDYTHRLICDGKTIADKKIEVKQQIEEITGMDRMRFCRAALLAQGEFDAFLSAGVNKSEILERITGTQIYSQIAEQLKIRYDFEKEKLNSYKIQSESIKLLSDEQVQQYQLQLQEVLNNISECNQKTEHFSVIISKYDKLNELSKKRDDFQQSLEKTKKDWLDFQPLLSRLESAKKAMKVYPSFQKLSELYARREENRNNIEKQNIEINNFQEKQKKIDLLVQQAIQEKDQCVDKHQQLIQIIKKVRELDQQLNLTKNEKEFLDSQYKEESIKSVQLDNSINEIKHALIESEQTYQSALEYVNSHRIDSNLSEKKVLWNEKIVAYFNKQRELEKLENDLKIFQNDVNEKNDLVKQELNKISKLSLDIQQIEDELTILQQHLNETLDGMTVEKWEERESLQTKSLLYLKTIHSFEEERKKLQNGKACPLCGAIEHPFAINELPDVSKEENALEETKKTIKTIRQMSNKLVELKNNKVKQVSNFNQSENLKKIYEAHLKEKLQCLEKINLDYIELNKNISSSFSFLKDSLMEFELSWNGENSLPLTLDERIELYNTKCRLLSEFELKKTEMKSHLENFVVQSQNKKELLLELQKKVNYFIKNFEQIQNERESVFGHRDPDFELTKSEELKNTLNLKCSHLIVQQAENRIGLTNLKTALDQFIKIQSELVQKEDEAKQQFDRLCKENGILSIDFEKSVLDPKEIDKLSEQWIYLEQEKKYLTETLINLENEMRINKSELLSSPSEKEIKESQENNKTQLAELMQNQALIQTHLQNDLLAKEEFANKMKEIESQQDTFNLWNLLYDFIGSKDKFQRIAQGITLDRLLGLANDELAQLTNRYLLIRNECELLGIDIVDQDQGGEIRSCKNLSGGERFLVSLALALGLSQMAGEKIRIDSLFLDEGFGSLDPDSLQIALNALLSLRNTGKMVGIISHVGGIEENIPCVIEVVKQGGGRSSISGPGVRNIKKD